MRTPLHFNLHHAIENHLLIEFNYEGQGIRIVEPFCLGITLAGNLGLRAYQVGGHSQSQMPEWKMFDLAKATDLKVLSQTFDPNTRGEYHIGDKHMKTIYLQVY